MKTCLDNESNCIDVHHASKVYPPILFEVSIQWAANVLSREHDNIHPEFLAKINDVIRPLCARYSLIAVNLLQSSEITN